MRRPRSLTPEWSLREEPPAGIAGKATLSAVIDHARKGEPSIITRHGTREAVVLSFEDWERLSRAPSFGRLMEAPLEPDDIPTRDAGALRDQDL